MSNRISGFTVFEFDLPQALLESLIKLLDAMDSGVLEHSSVSDIPDAQGVYQLFLDSQLVYIGKTDAEAGLRNRLYRHARRILHRKNLDQYKVRFKAVQILVFTAMDLESQLINHYKNQGSRPSWNDSGFGSNDPGRARETTNKRPDGFDVTYPIDIDRREIRLAPGIRPVSEVLRELKSTLPYVLRYETERTPTGRARPNAPHPDLVNSSVSIADRVSTARETLVEILKALPPGWQATEFPSHVILYKEQQRYLHGSPITIDSH